MPIDGANVSLLGVPGNVLLESNTSDSNGMYSINYSGGASYPIYTVKVDPITPYAGDSWTGPIGGDVTKNFDLAPAASVTVSGDVKNESGNGLGSATVKFFLGTSLVKTATADGAGHYSVTIGDGFDYNVEASLSGYLTSTDQITTSGSDITLDFTLYISCPDADGDGFNATWCGGNDCNDGDPAVNPGASEVCNGVDDNCDGQTDEGVQLTFYQDADSDGYGNAAVAIIACTAPAGYVADSSDCNDGDAGIHPGASEVCGNGIDEDCNGTDNTCPPPTGGGGWGGYCTPEWNCSEWSECIDGTQTRICTDRWNCGTTKNKPNETQACTVPLVQICTPGEAICRDGNVQQCSGDGTAWSMAEVCDYGCSDGACNEPPTGGLENETTPSVGPLTGLIAGITGMGPAVLAAMIVVIIAAAGGFFWFIRKP